MAISRNTSIVMMCVASFAVGFFVNNLVNNRTLDLTEAQPLAAKHEVAIRSGTPDLYVGGVSAPVPRTPQTATVSSAEQLKAEHNIERVYDAQLQVVSYKVMRDVPISVSCIASRDLIMQNLK